MHILPNGVRFNTNIITWVYALQALQAVRPETQAEVQPPRGVPGNGYNSCLYSCLILSDLRVGDDVKAESSLS